MDPNHHLSKPRDGTMGQSNPPGPPSVSPTEHCAVTSHFESYEFNFSKLSSTSKQLTKMERVDISEEGSIPALNF